MWRSGAFGLRDVVLPPSTGHREREEAPNELRRFLSCREIAPKGPCGAVQNYTALEIGATRHTGWDWAIPIAIKAPGCAFRQRRL